MSRSHEAFEPARVTAADDMLGSMFESLLASTTLAQKL